MTWHHQGFDDDVTGYVVRLFVPGTNTQIVVGHFSVESYHIVQGAESLGQMYYVQVRSVYKSLPPSERGLFPRFRPWWVESMDRGARLFP